MKFFKILFLALIFLVICICLIGYLVYVLLIPSQGKPTSTIIDEHNQYSLWQTKDVSASFVWSVDLYKPSYHIEYFLFKGNRSQKLASRKGELTKVLVSNKRIFFVVNKKELYEYHPETGAEVRMTSLNNRIKDVMLSQDGSKMALIEVISEDPEKIDLLVLEMKDLSLTKIGSLTGKLFEGFNLASWSSDMKNLYLASYSGDAGLILSWIFKADLENLSINEIKSFEYNSYDGDYLFKFNKTGERFYVVHDQGEEEITTQAVLKSGSLGDLSMEDKLTINLDLSKNKEVSNVIDFIYDKDADNFYYTSYFFGNSGEVAEDANEENLGFFELKDFKPQEIEIPGIGSFKNTCSSGLQAGNKDFLIYNTKDEKNLSSEIYIYQKNTKKSYKILSSISKSSCPTNDFEFLEWL